MKKTIMLTALLLTLCVLLGGCGTTTYTYMTDGVDYRNTELTVEYVSSETVSVTFSADIKHFRGHLVATVNLLSEGAVIGQCRIELLQGDSEYSRCSKSELVQLSYHNYGTVTAHVDSIAAFCVEKS